MPSWTWVGSSISFKICFPMIGQSPDYPELFWSCLTSSCWLNKAKYYTETHQSWSMGRNSAYQRVLSFLGTRPALHWTSSGSSRSFGYISSFGSPYRDHLSGYSWLIDESFASFLPWLVGQTFTDFLTMSSFIFCK